MDSALAAASLLLAIVALLFATWQADIAAASGFEASPDKGKTKRLRAEAVATLRTKAGPLALGAALAAAVFAWRALKIVFTLRFAGAPGYAFDDIGAAFVLTEVFVVLVAYVAVRQALGLRSTIAKLKE